MTDIQNNRDQINNGEGENINLDVKNPFLNSKWVNKTQKKPKQSEEELEEGEVQSEKQIDQRLYTIPIYPLERWGHQTIIIDQFLYLIGGYLESFHPKAAREQIYRLNCETFEWDKVPYSSSSQTPEHRDSHTLCLIQGKIYMFGGKTHEPSEKVKNDLWVFDPQKEKHQWKQINSTGIIPPPRESHQACTVDDRYMIIFGGNNGKEDDGLVTFGDMYVFDSKTNVWREVKNKHIGHQIEARDSFGMVYVDGYVYIFGGQGQNDIFYNDFYKVKFNIQDDGKTEIIDITPIISLNEGKKPQRRGSHSMCIFKNRYIFIIAGERREDNKFDIYVYDIQENIWMEVPQRKSRIPFQSQIISHSSSIYKDQIIIFGGLVLDTDVKSDSTYVMYLNYSENQKSSSLIQLEKKISSQKIETVQQNLVSQQNQLVQKQNQVQQQNQITSINKTASQNQIVMQIENDQQKQINQDLQQNSILQQNQDELQKETQQKVDETLKNNVIEEENNTKNSENKIIDQLKEKENQIKNQESIEIENRIKLENDNLVKIQQQLQQQQQQQQSNEQISTVQNDKQNNIIEQIIEIEKESKTIDKNVIEVVNDIVDKVSKEFVQPQNGDIVDEEKQIKQDEEKYDEIEEIQITENVQIIENALIIENDQKMENYQQIDNEQQIENNQKIENEEENTQNEGKVEMDVEQDEELDNEIKDEQQLDDKISSPIQEMYEFEIKEDQIVEPEEKIRLLEREPSRKLTKKDQPAQHNIQQLIQDETILNIRQPYISMSFLNSISNLISWPFSAFGLLIHNAKSQFASTVQINLMHQKKKETYQNQFNQNKQTGSGSNLQEGNSNSKCNGQVLNQQIDKNIIDNYNLFFQFYDDSEGFPHNDFVDIMYKFDSYKVVQYNKAHKELIEDEIQQQIKTQYGNNLKLAGLRLGANILFITKNKTYNILNVGLISSNGKINPNLQECVIFLFSLDMKKKVYLTESGDQNKRIILNSIAHIMNEEQLFKHDKGNHVYIFDLRRIPQVDREGYEFQYNHVSQDIVSKKKSQFKEKKDQVEKLIDYSLKSYIQHMYIKTPENMHFCINGKRYEFISYYKVLEKQKGMRFLKDINIDAYPMVKESGKVTIYEQTNYNDPALLQQQKESSAQSGNDSEMSNNEAKEGAMTRKNTFSEQHQGILIYQDERLLGRAESSEFGSYFIDKILNKSKNLSVLFKYVGVIELDKFFQPNLFYTGLDNSFSESSLRLSLKQFLKSQKQVQQKSDKIRSKSSENIEEPELRKEIKVD